MDLYFYLCRCKVVDALCFDFSLFNGLCDTLDKSSYGLGVRQLTDDECLLVQLLNFGTHFKHASTLTIVVFRDIDATACLEVRIEMKLLFVQVTDGSIADFAEVMGQNLRGESDSYTLCTLCQQQRILYG